jgi:hypothetical protein
LSAIKDWLNWTPAGDKIIRDSQETEVSKGTKPPFEPFEAPVSRESQIIRGVEPAPDEHGRNNLEAPPAGIKRLKSIKSPGTCPYTLPEGVRLVRYERKAPPVAVTVCSVVNDVPKFIGHALAELDARLHHPVQIKAGDSVFDLLSKLADCGLELRLEWPSAPTTENPPATPELNAHGEDVPF